MVSQYSTSVISTKLLHEITDALSDINYGSLEIYITNQEVVQITKKQIKKTSQK